MKKIRPWWGHDDHFHVRLKCPEGNSECISQSPIPEGNGCDATLDWWFSEEAKLDGRKFQAKSLPPQLPEACRNVLEGL